jgi:collagenase-like PrtC family protease
MSKITFSVATNFDPEIIYHVSKYNKDNIFSSVFGKLQTDILGGGRASMILPQVSTGALQEYIDLCHKYKLKFNYLINPMCLGGREFSSPGFHKKILKFLERLKTIGVDNLTINSPYLCELIKKQFPAFKVTIGLYAGVVNLQHIKYWKELGADEITLSHIVNRDFELLEQMLQYTRNSNLCLKLIANNICLHSCPYQINHGTGIAHHSRKDDHSNKLYIDYNLLSCNIAKIENPTKLIASEWIRPEDVVYYENICNKVGNYNLSIKLLERTKTTEFINRVIKAYATRNYTGNLLDIVAWGASKDTIQLNPLYFRRLLHNFNYKEVIKFIQTFHLPDINIDNKKLNGFIQQFINGNKCSTKICDDKGFANDNYKNSNNQSCSYCKKWALRTVYFDEKKRCIWINKAKRALNILSASKIFKLS